MCNVNNKNKAQFEITHKKCGHVKCMLITEPGVKLKNILNIIIKININDIKFSRFFISLTQ